MARHNKEGRGTDQLGNQYMINYQPDWLKSIKVTRKLESGRQSTKVLFRNPAGAGEQSPGDKVRTRIVCPDEGLDFEVIVSDPRQSVHQVKVTYRLPRGSTAPRGRADEARNEGDRLHRGSRRLQGRTQRIHRQKPDLTARYQFIPACQTATHTPRREWGILASGRKEA